MPDPITLVIEAITQAQPSLPGQIDRQGSEVEHHPAKDIGDGLRVRKDLMLREMGVCTCRIRQCGQADRDCRKASGNHRLHKKGACPLMECAALFPRYGNPHHDKAYRACGDVESD